MNQLCSNQVCVHARSLLARLGLALLGLVAAVVFMNCRHLCLAICWIGDLSAVQMSQRYVDRMSLADGHTDRRDGTRHRGTYPVTARLGPCTYVRPLVNTRVWVY